MNTTRHNLETSTAGPGVARVNVRGQFGFPELAGQVVSFDLDNTTSPCYVQKTDLSSGNNSVTIPESAGGVVIVPPVDNGYVLTLKGVNGDTGVAIHPTAPTVLTLAEASATFVLNASGAVIGIQFIWF